MSSPAPTSVALVTGGSGDIGREICRQLARTATIAVHCCNNVSAAREVVDDIVRAGGVAKAYKSALSDSAAARHLTDEVRADYGDIDVLVNCAGVTRDALVVDMTDEDFDAVVGLNLRAAWSLSRAVVRHMLAKRRGTIVNVSSAAATFPGTGQANYAASKAGLEGLTRALASELGRRGIRVNAVAPGVIEGRMSAAIRAAEAEARLRRIALRRFGRPEDVAAAVVFLASESANYITGQVLHVDGGRS